MTRVELIRHMLSELEAPSKPLTPWETQFVESVGDQFDRRSDLTDAQYEKLDAIYAEKTS